MPRGRFKVVIDPGHGGPDPGAVGIGGLRETDVVLDVCLQIARLLQARGVQVLMTRTSEVDVDLPPRVALANSSGADLFVSVHANALSMARPDVNGIETFSLRVRDRPPVVWLRPCRSKWWPFPLAVLIAACAPDAFS